MCNLAEKVRAVRARGGSAGRARRALGGCGTARLWRGCFLCERPLTRRHARSRGQGRQPRRRGLRQAHAAAHRRREQPRRRGQGGSLEESRYKSCQRRAGKIAVRRALSPVCPLLHARHSTPHVRGVCGQALLNNKHTNVNAVDRFRVTPLADALKNKSKVGGTLLQLSTGPALSEEPPSGSIVLPAIYCSNRVRVHLVITECANRVCQPSALTECANRVR